MESRAARGLGLRSSATAEPVFVALEGAGPRVALEQEAEEASAVADGYFPESGRVLS